VLTPVVETNGGRSAARRFRPFFVADENQFANRNVSSRFQGPPKYLQRFTPHTSIVEGTKSRCNCANSRSDFALATPFCTVMCGRQPCKSWELSHGLNAARYQSRISVNRAPRESRKCQNPDRAHQRMRRRIGGYPLRSPPAPCGLLSLPRRMPDETWSTEVGGNCVG
jgi:hypothetical protein